MTRLHRLTVAAYAALTCLYPGEFRRRYGGEMRLDFANELTRCHSAMALGVMVARACGDLVVSVAREWCASESLRLLIYAGMAHAGIWLVGLAIAARQWPGGPPLYPVVLTFAVLSVPGIAVILWRQRLRVQRAGCCSSGVAELD